MKTEDKNKIVHLKRFGSWYYFSECAGRPAYWYHHRTCEHVKVRTECRYVDQAIHRVLWLLRKEKW